MPKLLNFRFWDGWYSLNCKNTEQNRSFKIFFSVFEQCLSLGNSGLKALDFFLSGEACYDYASLGKLTGINVLDMRLLFLVILLFEFQEMSTQILPLTITVYTL